MNSQNPPSPKTPPRKLFLWKHESHKRIASSPSSHGPSCSSTPNSAKKISASKSCYAMHPKDFSPPKCKLLSSSPVSKHRSQIRETCDGSRPISQGGASNEQQTSHPSWSQSISSAGTSQTVTVDLDFPYGGWDEDSSNDSSSSNLEIVETENECKSSPIRRGKKRNISEVLEENNPIISGMGEEIERQLEAKAERNRLTVPNVKNILRSVITNPYVQAMVRRSIKTGDVAISGDIDDITIEPRITRAKARLLCDNDSGGVWSKVSDVTWDGTPLKLPQPSECQALINQDLNDDSEDDEEYKPGEDEPSDCEYLERDGSERGSERDISIEQSPAAVADTDTESCPLTPIPSPKPHITDSATQTNWCDDGIFKVPLLPPEPQLDQSKDENIALRTRSKLPLNEIPLEEIEQAFVPPDITPDLYDTTCDNADWQEFLKEFMQPMRPDPEVQNHDDDEEDPEYNVHAEEEIIDQEELRRDKAVKVSKRELNELMKELAELNDNMSSDEEDKNAVKDKGCTSSAISPGHSNILSDNEEMSMFLDAYMSLGTLTPLNTHKASSQSSRSPSTPTLHTPVPPASPPALLKTPGTGKKATHCDSVSAFDDIMMSPTGKKSSGHSIGKNSPALTSSGKKQSLLQNSELMNSSPSASCGIHNIFPLGKTCNGSDKSHTVLSNAIEGLASSDCSKNFGSKIAQITSQEMGYSFHVDLNDEEKLNVTQNGINLGQSLFSESLNVAYNNGWSNSNLQSNGEASANVDDPTVSVNSPESNSTPDPSENEEGNASEKLSGLMLFESSENVKMSPNGDVVIEDTVLLSAVQRLVLDQQMRQHVQLLTQHFLQSYQHPVFGHYASTCKEKLVTLKSLERNKEKSAFQAANLAPALQIISLWEDKLSSEDGSNIISFMEEQCTLADKDKRKRQHLYKEKLPQELVNLMGDSTAFPYPHLLPHILFRTCCVKRNVILPSEVELLVIGLEEFTSFLKEQNPHLRKCLRKATLKVTEYILIGRNPRALLSLISKFKFKKGNPVQYFYEHNCAPPTSHVVRPFNEDKMISLKAQPHYVLPTLWRDLYYPADK